MVKKQYGSQKGQSMVLVALALIAMLALAGLAIDGGNAFLQRRRAQNAADAASLEGAVTLCQGTVDEALLLQEISEMARANGVENADAVTVHYTTDDGTRLDAGTIAAARGVEVTVRLEFDTAFLTIVGVDTVAVSALAAAGYSEPTAGECAIELVR